uniref:Chemosensory protein n=1 Tax=Phenacoccus solenopsis TaxID=483260 RepID=A0A0C5K108_9HEMI|nr:chemosensory protein [Phenacoccus solenopsis]
MKVSTFKMDSKIISVFILISVIVTLSYAGEEEIKTIGDFLKKFGNINMEEVLQNDRLFQAYHKCFLEQGPCTPEAREMRNVIPSLVKTACDACTPEQKKEMKKHLDYARHNRAKEWEELLDKYDPKREILEKFLSSVPDK